MQEQAEEVTLKVKRMACEHCGELVESALMDLPGVLFASADVRAGEVHVKRSSSVTEAMLREAVEEAGYEL